MYNVRPYDKGFLFTCVVYKSHGQCKKKYIYKKKTTIQIIKLSAFMLESHSWVWMATFVPPPVATSGKAAAYLDLEQPEPQYHSMCSPII